MNNLTKALLIAPLCGVFFCAPAYAQKTKAQLSTEITTTFPDNTTGLITPSGIRAYESDVITSIMPTAPVVAGNLACFSGTTGLLQDCGTSPGIYALITSPTFTGTVTIPNGSILNTPASVTLTNATGLPVSTGISGLGTSIASTLANNLNATGGIVSPTPTRAGDVVFWSGSNWTTLAGNNSGTQILTENSTGVPSWAATGSVSSVTCGTGLSGGTITTTGTCAVNLSTATNILGADVAMNNTANYFDGPSMAQGTSGTWWISGTVTVTDTAGGAQMNCKLWDGTTVIASAFTSTSGANAAIPMALSGFLASPAANIKISCKDTTSVSGIIRFNASGNSKDSAIFGHRIQ